MNVVTPCGPQAPGHRDLGGGPAVGEMGGGGTGRAPGPARPRVGERSVPRARGAGALSTRPGSCVGGGVGCPEAPLPQGLAPPPPLAVPPTPRPRPGPAPGLGSIHTSPPVGHARIRPFVRGQLIGQMRRSLRPPPGNGQLQEVSQGAELAGASPSCDASGDP